MSLKLISPFLQKVCLKMLMMVEIITALCEKIIGNFL